MVIGQSGSGKSSFFHNVVIGGCYRYSPKDLQYWLLDFKFGGASSKYEFSCIPHVRKSLQKLPVPLLAVPCP